MAYFSYRIIAPRENFVSTISPEELQIMSEHFEYLKALDSEGKLVFAGRAENGDFGFGVFEFESENIAFEIISNDPVIKSGLMKYEFHPFKIAFERAIR